MEGFCCAPCCCRRVHSQRCPAAATSSGVTHPSGLTTNEPQAVESVTFFSSTTFPGVPRPHCCCIKDMHYPMTSKGVRRPGEGQLQGARIAVPPPEQIPQEFSELPQETSCQGEDLGQRT